MIALVGNDNRRANAGKVPHEQGVRCRLSHTSARQRLAQLGIGLDGYAIFSRDLMEAELSPSGPCANRTINLMQMFGWSMLHVNADRENT